ncbi:MAG: hypothetical protein NTW86_06425 [Candidatus Sumerlaeota bacterium]|nr:hypothetical protein [Candidatus Sumerlaeota bacterium]
MFQRTLSDEAAAAAGVVSRVAARTARAPMRLGRSAFQCQAGGFYSYAWHSV